MTIRQQNKSLYWAWKSMKQRCLNPKCKAYKNYGDRGINICAEWYEFEPFYNWAISNGYKTGLDLDRIDNDAGYSPNNCHWVTRRDNLNNRRVTTKLTVNGETKSRTEWESISNISPGTVKAWVITHGKEYAEKRIKKILENGYTKKDYGYSHRKAVVNIDTEKHYRSVREAAKDVNLAPCTISNAMRENRSTSKGRFEWEEPYVE